MSRTRNSKRKALTAFALSLVAAAALTATASGQQSPEIPYLSHGQGVAETQFQGSDSGPMFPNGVPYGYVGRGVDSGSESAPATPLQSSADGGPVFMNGVPDGYVGSGVESAPGGVTPTDQARSVQRYGPHGPLAHTQLVPDAPSAVVATAPAGAEGFDRDDVGIGFGLGLILAMAGAIALAATRGRTRMAHS